MAHYVGSYIHHKIVRSQVLLIEICIYTFFFKCFNFWCIHVITSWLYFFSNAIQHRNTWHEFVCLDLSLLNIELVQSLSYHFLSTLAPSNLPDVVTNTHANGIFDTQFACFSKPGNLYQRFRLGAISTTPSMASLILDIWELCASPDMAAINHFISYHMPPSGMTTVVWERGERQGERERAIGREATTTGLKNDAFNNNSCNILMARVQLEDYKLVSVFVYKSFLFRCVLKNPIKTSPRKICLVNLYSCAICVSTGLLWLIMMLLNNDEIN